MFKTPERFRYIPSLLQGVPVLLFSFTRPTPLSVPSVCLCFLPALPPSIPPYPPLWVLPSLQQAYRDALLQLGCTLEELVGSITQKILNAASTVESFCAFC